MQCPLCGYPKAHKHGKMPNKKQRYRYPICQQTSTEQFDTLYYRRQVSPEQIRQVLQSHSEDISLRGIARTSGLAYNNIGKDRTQRLEQTNGIIHQQAGRWHRRQNKFVKVWHQTKVSARLVVSYFN